MTIYNGSLCFLGKSLLDIKLMSGRKCCAVILCLFSYVEVSIAQDIDGAEIFAPLEESQDRSMSYPADFFFQYQPNTALDMVRQVPGFQLDDGDSLRGFGASLGNVLINGRSPSSKLDQSSAILSRIPASHVERIEVIRGQTGGLDLGGYSIVVNIYLRQDAKAAIQWQTYMRHYSTADQLKLGVNFSISDRWNDIDYNFGINTERESNGEYGPEKVYDVNGTLVEDRYDVSVHTGFRMVGISFKSSTWLGNNFLQLNSKFDLVNGPKTLTSTRIPQLNPNPHELIFKASTNHPSFEVGIDAERNINNTLAGKALMLFTHKDLGVKNTQVNSNSDGIHTFIQIADTKAVATEAISRLEFDWSKFSNHTVQFNIEAAYNALDGSLFQTVDTGAGPVVLDLAGANTLVEELRADVLLKDTWLVRSLELDYGLGMEMSRISQSGDDNLERNFSFVKPHSVFSYALNQSDRARLRIAREISQLDFNDFVSSNVFEDDDLAFGNPQLRPATTWISELGYEKRFSELSLIKLTAFHHWVSNTQDLLPISSIFETVGNIGPARRWGVEFETTLPLDWAGLIGARIDIMARLQDSKVTDPVTGNRRVLSAGGGFAGLPTIKFRNENRYVIDIAFRQDLKEALFAWGWDIAEQANRPLFKVNELDLYNEGVELNAFIETTRWLGLKIRIEGNNLLNFTEWRDRTIYTGQRDLSPVKNRIIRNRVSGRRLSLVLNGSF